MIVEIRDTYVGFVDRNNVPQAIDQSSGGEPYATETRLMKLWPSEGPGLKQAELYMKVIGPKYRLVKVTLSITER